MANFQNLLFKTSGILKMAADTESQQQLEQDFGRLAYTFFKDRAPQLLNYLLGFEIVDQEEDGSKAVGIFGCKIGDGYFYVPVFFVNNQIKGMDLLYSKQSNMFIPLQEGWINHILDKQATLLGEGTKNNMEVRKDFETPNFRFLQYPYQYNKIATVKDIVNNAFTVWNEMQTKLAEMMDNDKDMQLAWLGAFLKLTKKGTLEKTADGSKLIEFLENHGGPKAVGSLMNSFDSHKFANAALTFYPSVESLFVHKFNMEKPAEEKIKVITSEQPHPASLSDEDRKQIVRDGFTIKDIRDPKEKSEMFAVNYTKRFTTPDEPGLYNVLLANGGTTEAWVLMPTKPFNNCFVVVEPKKMFAITADPKRVIARDIKLDEAKSIYSKAVSLDDVKPDNHYIAINEKLNASGMFRVRTVRAANEMRTELDVCFDNNPLDVPKEKGTWDAIQERGSDPNIIDIDTIQIGNFDGDKLRLASNKLIVPKDWKFLEVTSDDWSLDDGDRAIFKSFKPGTLLDLDEALLKNALNNLVIEHDNGEYYISFNDFNEGPFNYKTAAVRLVRDYGFDFNDSMATLTEATNNIKARRLVKLAQSSGVGVMMPKENPQQFGVDSFNGIQTQEPDVQSIQGTFTGVPQLRDPMRYGFNLGGETDQSMNQFATGQSPLQEDVNNLAQQAAESGQKSVFDHATIAGLAKLYDVSNVIDTYIPEMVKALDRIGRILFLFYWKNEEFVDRYGNEDLNDVEDLLRSVFKSYGDLILKFKEKAISTSIDDLV